MSQLPVASSKRVRKNVSALLTQYRGSLTLVTALQISVALAGLATPFLLGRLVDHVSAGGDGAFVDSAALAAAGAVTLQALLAFFASRMAMIMGESVFATVRERLLHAVAHLPLSEVEKAGTGDLLGRATNDVGRIQWVVRFGLPRVLVIAVTVIFTFAATILISPLLSLAMLVGLPAIWVVMRWYLRRAVVAYRATSAAYSRMAGVVTESVEHADTIDALGIAGVRRDLTDRSITEMWRLEVYTSYLRIGIITSVSFWLYVPVAAVVLWGAFLLDQGVTTIGAITTVAMYANQLRSPLGELSFWIDEIQTSTASLSRIYGVEDVPADRTPTGQKPTGSELSIRDVTYEYVPGRPVLHGVSLDLRPGERLAVVGPSGSGKSTLGRMLAGIHGPTTGSVRVGGVELTDLTEAELRKNVALVTQEHHVFVGTIADNLRLAKADATDEEIERALRVVGSWEWVSALEDGMFTKVGSGAKELDPAKAQEIALARLLLLDPHTLILDEATSLLDPRAARSLEASLNAVLTGRTVVAIAHRLHTAHDADRVAVVIDGRIAELGSHDELVAAGGEYASLWASWQHE
ncbi:ABC transporter ATP-binding protein [Buchananella felis]|uniref:ABC transporter ATP-binding protein n=1 Tax=Buchananella felis TaxID=3231492 RepID=UPI003528BACD